MRNTPRSPVPRPRPAQEVLAAAPDGKVAFLSTPSVFFSLPQARFTLDRAIGTGFDRQRTAAGSFSSCAQRRAAKQGACAPCPAAPPPTQGSAARAGAALLDADEASFGRAPGFVRFDYRAPEALPARLRGGFSLAVIDPPFISESVWRQVRGRAAPLGRAEGSLSAGVRSRLVPWKAAPWTWQRL
jgi:hypothetical protein